MLKYAIVGVGTLGHTHLNSSTQVMKDACTEVKLVALCDIRKEVFTENDMEGKAKGCNIYTSVDDLLANEELDFVVTALPTYLHAEIGIKIMKKGIHLFSEKPMAISYEEAAEMVKVAKEMNVKLMIGQCSRYEPRHTLLKKIIKDETYGKVIHAYFERCGHTPMGWEGWFRDGAKSGGAALDLHVHDVDVINFLFGIPNAVASVATNYKTQHDCIRSLYYYDDVVVTSMCDWGTADAMPAYNAAFLVRFEKASIHYARGVMTLFPDGTKESSKLDYGSDDSYALEVIDFVDCIVNNKKSAINDCESTLESTRLAFAEKNSADAKTLINL